MNSPNTPIKKLTEGWWRDSNGNSASLASMRPTVQTSVLPNNNNNIIIIIK
jgi:hypothetical protein